MVMKLKLYNTPTGEKETFRPVNDAFITMYVCGPTVYDRIHIGNARSLVIYDVLNRILAMNFGTSHIYYVRNITDIDDKIINQLKETKLDLQTFTDKMISDFHEDEAYLGCQTPDFEPRATENLNCMKDLINKLLLKNAAYVSGNHVFFKVDESHHGRLSGRRLNDHTRARVSHSMLKHSQADFVLWKPAVPDEPGWPSPWGRGRPGWHVECSAMSTYNCGDTIDIHGGGMDLIFPHHDNEIAQSECANGVPLANYWVHNGFVTIDSKKMSKSLGNVVQVKDLRETYDGEVVRLALLMTHYRSSLDWTASRLTEAKATLDKFYGAIQSVEVDYASMPEPSIADPLNDDMNVPKVIELMHQYANDIRRGYARGIQKSRLLVAGKLLGILQQKPEDWFKRAKADIDVARVEKLIDQRSLARVLKDYQKSDEIRVALNKMGIEIEDTKTGTTWKRA